MSKKIYAIVNGCGEAETKGYPTKKECLQAYINMLKKDYEDCYYHLHQEYQEWVEDWLELDPSVKDTPFEEFVVYYSENFDEDECPRCVEIELAK
jgi:hypothetical protein